MTLWILATYALPLILAALRWAWDRAHRPKPAATYRITVRTPMQVGVESTLTLVALDQYGNTTEFAAGTVGTWPTFPPATAGAFTPDPTNGLSAKFTPTVVQPDTFGSSVVIAGTAVPVTFTDTPLAGPAVTYKMVVTP